MRSTHTEAVALDLPQNLAIDVRRHANREPTVLQVANASNANLVLSISPSDLRCIECAAISVAQRRWAARG
jgi:hypothetical protein